MLSLFLGMASASAAQPKLQVERAAQKSGAADTLPAFTGRVVDNANIIGTPVETDLVARLEALEKETSDQLVVVTVPSLEGEPIEAFGLRLGNGWRIGREALDNGILLIVAPSDGRVRIEVGYGVEGLLTDERARQIIDEELVPQFKLGNFELGISSGVAAIIDTLRSDRRRPIRKSGWEA